MFCIMVNPITSNIIVQFIRGNIHKSHEEVQYLFGFEIKIIWNIEITEWTWNMPTIIRVKKYRKLKMTDQIDTVPFLQQQKS